MPSPSMAFSRSSAYLSGCDDDSPLTATHRWACSVLRRSIPNEGDAWPSSAGYQPPGEWPAQPRKRLSTASMASSWWMLPAMETTRLGSVYCRPM